MSKPTLKKDFISKSSQTRLHGIHQPIVGLTGNIACGKSTVAQIFRERGLKVIDADALIHKIYTWPETLEFIAKEAPQSLSSGVIDFPVLREQFFNDKNLKTKLESFLYSKLPQAFQEELPSAEDTVIYDVPLLFEKDMRNNFDVVFTVSTSPDIQLQRLKKRDPETSLETFNKIIANQMPLHKKEQLCEFVFKNNGDMKNLEGQVDLALEKFFD